MRTSFEGLADFPKMPTFGLPQATAEVTNVRVINDNIASVSDGDGDYAESQASDETVSDTVLSALTARLDRGVTHIQTHISKWNLSDFDARGYQMIKSPTASHIRHETIHGALILGLQESPGGLQGVADTLGADVDFETKFQEVMQFHGGMVKVYLKALVRLPEASDEDDIQGALGALINCVAMALNVTPVSKANARMAVGGILAQYQFDIRGETDICVRNTDGDCLLVVECKTRKSFRSEENWYRKSRAAQVLTALYHFNGPTILATNHYWKLFYENEERDTVFTYPTARQVGLHQPRDFRNSLKLQVIGDDFIKVLIICLSAKPAELPISEASSFEVGVSNSMGAKEPDSAQKPPRDESADKKQKKEAAPKTNPSYETTNERGERQRVHVRLFDDEALALMDWSG